MNNVAMAIVESIGANCMALRESLMSCRSCEELERKLRLIADLVDVDDRKTDPAATVRLIRGVLEFKRDEDDAPEQWEPDEMGEVLTAQAARTLGRYASDPRFAPRNTGPMAAAFEVIDEQEENGDG